MSKEFEISASLSSELGLSGKFKRVDSFPYILTPCQHLINEKKRLFRHSTIITIHGKDDGSTKINQTRVD